MSKSSLPKNIALILFGAVVILLVNNIVISKYINKDEPPKDREALSGIEIDRSFHLALKNYGFSESWISKRKIKNIPKKKTKSPKNGIISLRTCPTNRFLPFTRVPGNP